MPTDFLQKHPSIFPGYFEKIPMKSKENQNISCNNSATIIGQIEFKDLKKARKSKKQFSLPVKYCNIFFSFLIFSQLLSVLSPAFFTSLLSVVRNFLEVPGHVYLILNLLLYHKQKQLAFQEHLS